MCSAQRWVHVAPDLEPTPSLFSVATKTGKGMSIAELTFPTGHGQQGNKWRPVLDLGSEIIKRPAKSWDQLQSRGLWMAEAFEWERSSYYQCFKAFPSCILTVTTLSWERVFPARLRVPFCLLLVPGAHLTNGGGSHTWWLRIPLSHLYICQSGCKPTHKA